MAPVSGSCRRRAEALWVGAPESQGPGPNHSFIHWQAFLEYVLGCEDLAGNRIETPVEALRCRFLVRYYTQVNSPAMSSYRTIRQAPFSRVQESSYRTLNPTLPSLISLSYEGRYCLSPSCSHLTWFHTWFCQGSLSDLEQITSFPCSLVFSTIKWS